MKLILVYFCMAFLISGCSAGNSFDNKTKDSVKEFRTMAGDFPMNDMEMQKQFDTCIAAIKDIGYLEAPEGKEEYQNQIVEMYTDYAKFLTAQRNYISKEDESYLVEAGDWLQKARDMYEKIKDE